MIYPDDWLGIKIPQDNPNCDWTQQERKGQGARSRDGSSGQKAHVSSIHIVDKAISLRSGGLHQVTYQYTPDRVKISARSQTPSPTRSSFPSTRVHREECIPPYRRVNKVRKEIQGKETAYPPPIVGRLGTSGELGSPHKMSDCHSTTMVRMPRTSGDSGFHRGPGVRR